MAYMDEDDPDYWNDRRRAQDDMRSVLRDNSRYGDDGESMTEWYMEKAIYLVIIIAVVSFALYFSAGWLDQHFGTHLVSWLNHVLPQWMHRK